MIANPYTHWSAHGIVDHVGTSYHVSSVTSFADYGIYCRTASRTKGGYQVISVVNDKSGTQIDTLYPYDLEDVRQSVMHPFMNFVRMWRWLP